MKVVAVMVGVPLLAFVAYIIAFQTVDPSARVTVTHEPNGDYRFDIEPNFVVRGVYRISVIGPDGLVSERNREQVPGDQQFVVSSGLTPNMPVTVECGLQYDRGISACGTTQQTRLILP